MLQSITLEEKLAISNRSIVLEKAGGIEGSVHLMKTILLPPYLAKIAKEKVRNDYLINSGWNLSEAEAEFGEHWLSR